MGKLIIITAPSGSGKTTIVRHLLDRFPQLAFSVSATNRPPREGEVSGRDYYFLSSEAFQEKIREGAFVEWEEVYPGRFYGTLRAEIERLWADGKHVIFDIDTRGAINLKSAYPERTRSVFIQPPSMEVLRERLQKRDTEGEEELRIRLDKAEEEMTFRDRFDRVLVNDELPRALREAETLVEEFLRT